MAELALLNQVNQLTHEVDDVTSDYQLMTIPYSSFLSQFGISANIFVNFLLFFLFEVFKIVVSRIFFVEISTALSGLAFYVIVYLDMIGHKNSHLASVTFQVLALEMKVPLVWDM